ncbi:MAG: peptidoglycan bridge formation glycyltransferase FemA/FemB family protein [Ktedonobacteraceae bacterium]|nr:peptidoglycan bridge formation glycyltransferase FemA/FemB family protein [Ktedonobacteraceae bacterium]
MLDQNARYALHEVTGKQRDMWDSFINAHMGGHLLQSWDWGELKAHTGWWPLRLGLWDRETGEMAAAAQLLRRSAPHLPLWLGHLAYIPRGPVIDWSHPDLCSAFFRQLDDYLSGHGALALWLEPDEEAGTPAGELVGKRLDALPVQPVRAVQPVRTIVVDLAPAEEELLAKMKEKWRYNIRLAMRKGVTVRVAASEQDVYAWYRLLSVTAERDRFGIHTVDYYLRAWQMLTVQDRARLLLAEYDGQVLAGIFVSCFARQAIYLYGASSNEQRNLMPNYLLQWEAMRWSKQKGAATYDLWGIPETDAPEEAMAGVYRFKSGWGGRIIRFVGAYERVYHPLLMRLARRFLHSS